MPSNYDGIREDNIREYGQGTRHLSFLGRLYTDRTHFVFELLQNAEDAGASQILFRLFEDRLEVTHDGRPFNEADVRGVCGVGEGTKAEDLTQIGKFGIGFKSVYAYTSTPEVHSGDESFRIDNYVRPYPVEPRRAGNSWTTLFVFALDAVGIDPNRACYDIGARLRDLSARTLLFLKKIKVIEYSLPDDTTGIYLLEEVDRNPAREVTVIGRNNSQDEEESWLIFKCPVRVPHVSRQQVVVEVGFRHEAEVITRVRDVPLVVYFPTEKRTGLGFLIQGPYRTTPARDNIPKEDDWNKKLVEETAHLVVESTLQLKEMGLLSVSLLETLPIRTDDFSEDNMFYPIFAAVRDALMNEDLLPSDDGTLVSARNAKLARGSDLRALLNQDQLRSLFQSNATTIKWLAGEITQDRTPDLRSYLLNELHVEEITSADFARKITPSFLACQSDDWFVRFYEYLSGQEALWRSKRWAGDEGGLLRAKPILRLQDDSQKEPFRSDGTPNAFLPPPDDTDFPIVKRLIANDPKAKDFLKRLGLSEPDVYDDIVERVLPKYIRPDASSISPHEHIADIQKVLRALRSDSEAGKRKVKDAVKQTPFVKAVDHNGKTAYQKPVDVYFRTQELKDYFFGSSDAWLLSETECEEDCRIFEIADKPRFKKIKIDLPWKEKKRLRGDLGHTRDIKTTDYELDGIDNFLLRFSGEKKPFDCYSLILWNFLLGHLKERVHYPFYQGEYKWFFYQEQSAIFDAKWKKQLRSHAWLPKNGDDVPHLPSELRLVDLPDSFQRNDNLADLLGMKLDFVAILAEKAGVQTEDIELMRLYPEEFQRWKADIVARNIKPAFPKSPTANPERRQERLTEQLADAHEKDYQVRERSVRTTRATVDPALRLRNQYTNEEGQMVCQICKKEMPFRKRDGEYYFEAVEAFSEDYFSKEHESQYLALCPLCAAMFKEFIKRDESAMQDLCDRLRNSEEPEVSLNLGEVETTIRFVESHFTDIRTILRTQ